MTALTGVIAGTWSETPGKLWKVGGTAEGGARENPAFPPFLRLAAASIGRCCTCVPGVFDQMLIAEGVQNRPLRVVACARCQGQRFGNRITQRQTPFPAV